MNSLNDKEIMEQVLNNLKSLAVLYHYATQEASTETLYPELKHNMDETLCKAHETYKAMEQKGFYKVENAPQTELTKLKDKITQAIQSLNK